MNRTKPILASLVATLAFAAPALAANPTDPQIAHIVVTANTVDVQAGEFASKKTKNPDVKKFADLMVTDHTAVNKSATDLAKKLGVKPENNDTSKSLADGGKKNIAHLKKLKGEAFDKAYVDHEVDYHVAVLDAIDKVLIPNAQNAELKALIVQVRPAIAAHLEHAKMLQAELAKK
jgi:putative membrane protein